MSRWLPPLHLVLGPIIWAGWFVTMYAGLSVACSVAPPAPGARSATWLNGGLLVLTLVVAAWLSLAGWRCWRQATAGDPVDGYFIGRVSAGAYLLLAASTLMIGAPVILLPPCP